MSLPVRGAWIEMPGLQSLPHPPWSLPVRGAWIEISRRACSSWIFESLPVRGAWIEIVPWIDVASIVTVAPRKGSVD